MGIFDFLKPTPKAIPKVVQDIPDEDYELPELSRGQFRMTNELYRRQEDEALKKKYGIHTDKVGDYV